MRFEPALEAGVLVRRYKRFLADITLDDGEVVTMHCANTGAMAGCADPGSRVWYSTSSNPKRKYPHSWEIVENARGESICVNTARANQIVGEALADGSIELDIGQPLRRETPIPGESGRFDFGNDDTVVEVKSVTLSEGDKGAFPDAVSDRATRHVRALMHCRSNGLRAILLFFVPHTGIRHVTTADEIDPLYAETLREAVDAGVEVVAFGCDVTPDHIAIAGRLPIYL